MSNKQLLLGNRSRGLLFVFSAPAGTGKTTLVNMLTKEFDCVKPSISCTTRPKRSDEVDGVHYHFLNDEAFAKKVEANEFLEHVTLFGYRYGTSKRVVEQMQAEGKHVVLVIDTQGALALMGKEPAIFIFLMPPSLEELGRRLLDRGTETRDTLAVRLSEAGREIATASAYHYVIVNDDLEIAYQVLRSIVIAEEHRVT
jgi:guanylate kinase